ncbi:MAG: DNA polymerase IV [Deltaproteobacteria bacterium]|nr:DNA polymerase IV [Deltaproteobacteria bacterium]
MLELSGLRPRVCCLDLDTFFVSVERLLDPSLEGKPVVVGGKPGERGVVTACSYEVRAFGVRSGMSLVEAGKLAPHAIYLPGRHGVYGGYAKRVREIVARVAPEIQVASIDEMYMSLAGCERLYHQPGDVDGDATILRTVRALTATIKTELGLPASVGIACTKTMAKVASGLAKPAGVLMVPAEDAEAVLAPLPVRKLPGIGPVAERKLAGIGVQTLGQVADTPLDALRPIFGAWAESIKRGARGGGAQELGAERPAFREHDPEGGTVGSISNERTFREDVRDPAVLESVLTGLVERVCWRARRRGVVARTVTLKLRYADFETLSRGRSITPSASERDVLPVIRGLFAEARTRRTPIRLLGVAFSNLQLASQPSLFRESEALGEAIDVIRERFGYDAVHLAPARVIRDRL